MAAVQGTLSDRDELCDVEACDEDVDIGSNEGGITSGLLLWIIANGFIFAFILFGNLLTIIAVRTCRKLRSVISNLFILSLAISDFTVGLSLPYHVAFYMGFDLGKIRVWCLLRFFLVICACCVSILTLISIAIDRYIAIMYALHYTRYMTRRVAYMIIFVNWLVGGMIALIPIFWNNWSSADQCEFDEVLSSWYIAGIITPGFVFIWLCMLIIYWRILGEASKQAQKLRHSTVFEETHTHTHTHGLHGLHPDWKSLQIVVFIMGCFTLCWLPFFIVAITQLFRICRSTSMIHKAAFSLAMVNSALNPIIYSWKNATFRKAFAQTLCCSRTPLCCPPHILHDSERVCHDNHAPLDNIVMTTTAAVTTEPPTTPKSTTTMTTTVATISELECRSALAEVTITPLSALHGLRAEMAAKLPTLSTLAALQLAASACSTASDVRVVSYAIQSRRCACAQRDIA